MHYVQDSVRGARVLLGHYGDTVLVISMIIAALGGAISLMDFLSRSM